MPGDLSRTVMQRTLFDKIWDFHCVAQRADGRDLIYIDRHVLHELHAHHAFAQLQKQGRAVRRADLTFAVQDHTVATRPGRDDDTNPSGSAFIKAMREGCRSNGIRLFDIDDPEQGISHVVAPELGIVLPGATHAVPDSHASTVGGIGALAFGCGTSELAHILATQVMALKRPKRMRVQLDGQLPGQLGVHISAKHVSAKDVALRIIAEIGVAGARGYGVEYAGAVVRAMPIEQRMTLCNLNIEMGGRSGFVAPDDMTFEWLACRPFVPQGAAWDRALQQWRTLTSDDDASFDREVRLDCTGLEPQITWGTDPSQVVGISGRVPDPAALEPSRRAAAASAFSYMGLAPGTPLLGLPVDRVFIGSCTNSRLSDLRVAAELVRGRHVAEGVVAMVVPGSSSVKREAEAAGLDRVFREAGFFWGESGCSMCAGGNGDRGQPGERCVSTTNRNFENRQGPKVRTHLASPATAAASAIAGSIADARQLAPGMA
jgi:3-isopropylmalate/(R)-2-methylmalate dehydratase large subunit